MPQPTGFQLIKALEKVRFHEVPGGKGSHRKLSKWHAAMASLVLVGMELMSYCD